MCRVVHKSLMTRGLPTCTVRRIVQYVILRVGAREPEHYSAGLFLAKIPQAVFYRYRETDLDTHENDSQEAC